MDQNMLAVTETQRRVMETIDALGGGRTDWYVRREDPFVPVDAIADRMGVDCPYINAEALRLIRLGPVARFETENDFRYAQRPLGIAYLHPPGPPAPTFEQKLFADIVRGVRRLFGQGHETVWEEDGDRAPLMGAFCACWVGLIPHWRGGWAILAVSRLRRRCG